jgi:hypothetical protein
VRAQILTTVGSTTDRAVLRFMERLWLSGGRPQTDADPADRLALAELYGGARVRADPLAFFPEPPAPDMSIKRLGRLSRGRRERLRWESGYRTWDPDYQDEYDGYRSNRFAWAETWRHEGFGHPTIICVHAWMTGSFPLQRYLYGVRRLYRSGLDVVIPILPFHGPRNPAGSQFSGQLFPGTSPQRTSEAFGQSAWDIRSLIATLQAERSGPIGVMGMSLGGYIAAMLASVEPRLAFSIPMIPMVSMGDLLWSHGKDHPVRKEAEARGVTLELVNQLYSAHGPLELTPVLPRERLMIVAGKGDQICTTEQIDRLWRHWDEPRIHWFSGGHVLHFGRRSVFTEVLDFVRGLP